MLSTDEIENYIVATCIHWSNLIGSVKIISHDCGNMISNKSRYIITAIFKCTIEQPELGIQSIKT